MSVTDRRTFLKLGAFGALAARRLEAVQRAGTSGGVLYNGIALPTPWPPVKALSNEPIAPPYLVNPPAVIPIGVGRQLFVDDFLIESTTLRRLFHQPAYHPRNPVLEPDRPWERRDESARVENRPANPTAMAFSDGVFFDPGARLFKMWYMGGYLESTCLATSDDGVAWKKPDLGVVPGTNIVDRQTRDSSTVWLDLADVDRSRRYKMTAYRRPSLVSSVSADGIHWRTVGRPVAGGDRSTLFYNPFRQVWVYSIRAGGTVGGPPRHRLYWEQPVFGSADWNASAPCPWIGADRLDRPRADLNQAPELYNLDCAAYESVMLGLFTVWRGESGEREKPNDVCLGFSRDGFHWDRPDRRPFLAVSEDPNAWNHANVQSAGGCCLVVGDKLYFYVSGRTGRPHTSDPGVCTTGLATLRRDGFASMEPADARGGTLTTRPVRFDGDYLFVNADAQDGEIRVEILDDEGRPIAPFLRERSSGVRGDGTRLPVRWDGADRISGLRSRAVRFRFQIGGRARLYAFWVSPSRGGASRGFVAAGGPAFSTTADV